MSAGGDTTRECDACRTAVEAYTGKSTWDKPFSEFEWAVIEDTLENCRIHLTPVGLMLGADGDDHYRSLERLVDDTLQLYSTDTLFHPKDVADTLLSRREIAAALREAASRIEPQEQS